MNKSITPDVTQYSIKNQEYLLSQIFTNPDLYVRCKNILKPEYFDKIFQNSIQYVHEYSNKYNGGFPTLLDIEVKSGFQYTEIKVSELNKQAVLDHCGEFCRHKALALAVEKGMELVQQKKYGGIEELIREAMLVTVQNELGLDVYENPEETIQSLKDMQGSMRSGWDTLDFKLFGGFGKQELEIFAAASGGGKSVVLQNIAVNFSKMGLNGAYISLELAEELVAVRIYGMMTDTKLSTIKSDASNIGMKIAIDGKQSGSLRIKRLPESITTSNDIESYIRELQIKTGIKLDYICVDYLDLMTSERSTDASNVFVKDKFVSEELRALAHTMDMTVFTAAQFNRSGINEEKKSQAQIAGGMSKIYTADNVIYIETNKDKGELWFDFQKTRNSSAVGSKLRMSYNMDSLRVLDHAQTIQELECNKSGFKLTQSTMGVGGGSVMQPPSTMTSLRHSLYNANMGLSQPVEVEHNIDSISVLNTDNEDVLNSPVQENETIEEFEIVESVQTKLSPSKISNMRDFLGKR